MSIICGGLLVTCGVAVVGITLKKPPRVHHEWYRGIGLFASSAGSLSLWLDTLEDKKYTKHMIIADCGVIASGLTLFGSSFFKHTRIGQLGTLFGIPFWCISSGIHNCFEGLNLEYFYFKLLENLFLIIDKHDL